MPTAHDADPFGPVYHARIRAVLLMARDGVDPSLIMQSQGISRPTYYRWLKDAKAAEARRNLLRLVRR